MRGACSLLTNNADLLRLRDSCPAKDEPVREHPASRHFPDLHQVLEIQMPRIRSLRKARDALRRPAHQPAQWIGDFGICLEWRKLLQYRFKKLNHININEELCLRSLFRHMSSQHPVSRFGVLLEAGVAIGCNAKGRSSSMSLNFYLSTSLPFILGGELFPRFVPHRNR